MRAIRNLVWFKRQRHQDVLDPFPDEEELERRAVDVTTQPTLTPPVPTTFPPPLPSFGIEDEEDLDSSTRTAESVNQPIGTMVLPPAEPRRGFCRRCCSCRNRVSAYREVQQGPTHYEITNECAPSLRTLVYLSFFTNVIGLALLLRIMYHLQLFK